jgi:ubiquinone/menaquinone biosynthesis C-methylase UbiE
MRLLSLPIMRNSIHALGHDYDLRVPVWFKQLAWLGFVYLVAVTVTTFAFFSPADLWTLLPIGGLFFLPALLVILITHFTRHLRLHLRDRMISAVTWRGDEQVLDIGTGSGITLFGCARQLTTGKAIGIDIYDPNAGGGTPAIFWKNAHQEGVADRVELQNVNACQMPFADASFDVVVSTLAFHHIHSSSAAEGRRQAAREIVRVLRPGGMVLIFDVGHTLAELEQVLRAAGVTDIQPSGHFFRLLQAQTPK